MREVSAHVKVSWKVYGVLDTVETYVCVYSSGGRYDTEVSILPILVLDLLVSII